MGGWMIRLIRGEDPNAHGFDPYGPVKPSRTCPHTWYDPSSAYPHKNHKCGMSLVKGRHAGNHFCNRPDCSATDS